MKYLINIVMWHVNWHFRGMMTSSNGNIFRVTGPLWGESTGHRWIPLTKASHAEFWCFLWSEPNGWANNREAGNLRRHYDVTVMGACRYWGNRVSIRVSHYWRSSCHFRFICSCVSKWICQQLLMFWPRAVRQQAITWTKVGRDSWRHMSSLGHNELILQTYDASCIT